MRLLRTAFEQGINHFDTAPLYGQGYAEKLVGNFIRNRRDKVSVATKFGLGNPGSLIVPAFLALPLNYYRKSLKKPAPAIAPVKDAEPQVISYRQISVDYVKKCLVGSLQRLNTNYLDYYLLHEALPGFLDADAFDFLQAQKKSGVIRHLGVATGSQNLLTLNKNDLNGWDILQYEVGNNGQLLAERFPDKQHFLHSCLKDLRLLPAEKTSDKKYSGGYQLGACAKNNRNDKLIFATRRIQVLKKNMQEFREFMN